MAKSPTKGLLFIALGSPATPETKAVRLYLKNFLSDPRILPLPAPLRYLLLHGIILPRRSSLVAQRYQKIWTSEGSPQTVNTQQFFQAIKFHLSDTHQCRLAFQYASPGITESLQQLLTPNITQLGIIPLFPHYTSAVTGSILEAIFHTLNKELFLPELHFLNQFFTEDFYLSSLTLQVKNYLDKIQKPDHILFSYHGLPLSQVPCGNRSESFSEKSKHVVPPLGDSSGDCIMRKDQTAPCPDQKICYREQCEKTSRDIMKNISVSIPYSTCFQSRTGKGKWLKPDTRKTLRELQQKKKQRILMVCPSFTTDCLETLYEIDQEEKELFFKNGGEFLARVPCLNSNSTWVSMFANFIKEWF